MLKVLMMQNVEEHEHIELGRFLKGSFSRHFLPLGQAFRLQLIINITYSMHGKDPDHAADMLTVFPLRGDKMAMEKLFHKTDQ